MSFPYTSNNDHMRVLFIVRSFAPDSIIASKRPVKFAKYLSSLGHDVYVIRSGLIFGKVDTTNLEGLEKVKIYSYERNNCPAEHISKDQMTSIAIKETKNVDGKENRILFPQIKKMLRLIVDPVRFYIKDGKTIYNKIVELYKTNKEIRGFDVVISSFSPLGCIQAGEYISKLEGSKWIIDFRDLMDNQNFSGILRMINAKTQSKYVKKSDACLCVSEGNTKRLQSIRHGKYAEKIHTIYNGYEEVNNIEDNSEIKIEDGLFHICYTGTMHGGARDATPLFSVLKDLKQTDNIRIDYAGKDSAIIIQQASKYNLEQLIVDHGYLTSTEVAQIQENADLFLVLSWNTRKDQGILTGKFYEALQHRKPIIALVDGDVPNSEIKILIDRYNLGICYEEATKAISYQILRDYLREQISRKSQGKIIKYNPDTSVFSKFVYQEITKDLEKIML